MSNVKGYSLKSNIYVHFVIFDIRLNCRSTNDNIKCGWFYKLYIYIYIVYIFITVALIGK